MQKTRRPGSSRTSGSGFSVQLRLPGFVAAVCLVVIGMAWSFILGVVVGRGHHPEQVVEDVVRQAIPQTPPANTSAVLRPEDLQFFEKLHHLPKSDNATASSPSKDKEAKAKDVGTTNASGQSPQAQTPKAMAKPKVPAPATPSSPVAGTTMEQQFLFSYQVAALNTAADAETLVQRLKKAGVEAKVQKGEEGGKTWFRVLVQHQGTVESAMNFKERLKQAGFAQPVLRSRQPVDIKN